MHYGQQASPRILLGLTPQHLEYNRVTPAWLDHVGAVDETQVLTVFAAS